MRIEDIHILANFNLTKYKLIFPLSRNIKYAIISTCKLKPLLVWLGHSSVGWTAFFINLITKLGTNWIQEPRIYWNLIFIKIIKNTLSFFLWDLLLRNTRFEKHQMSKVESAWILILFSYFNLKLDAGAYFKFQRFLKNLRIR